MGSPEGTATIEDFIIAGKSDNRLSYSKLSFLEKKAGIIFPVHNAINDYREEFIAVSEKVLLTDAQYIKYRHRPKLLAYDIYNNTELYFIILMINNICNIKEFDTRILKLIKPDTMNDMLNRIFNSDKNNIDQYNTQKR